MKYFTIHQSEQHMYYDVHAYGDSPLRMYFSEVIWMIAGAIASHKQISLLRFCRDEAYHILPNVREGSPIKVVFSYENGTKPQVSWHELDNVSNERQDNPMTDNRIFPSDKVEGITDHDEALEKAIKSSDKFYVETAVAGTIALISKKEMKYLLNDHTSDNWKVIYFAGFRSCSLYPRGENDDKLEIYAPTVWIEQNFNLFSP